MSERALLLIASDFQPLRESLDGIDGPLRAVEQATIAHYRGDMRQSALSDDVRDNDHGMNSFRVSLAAGIHAPTGMRIFGNPPNSRCYLLFDGESRKLRALMDYGVLNSLRVGAIAALAAQRLAEHETQVLGMLGSGWQARTQVQAMLRVFPGLQRIQVFSPTQAHRESFALEMSDWLDVPVVAVSSAEAATRDADVVTLVAPAHDGIREPLLESAWVKPGAVIISTAGNQSSEKFVDQCRVVVGTWQGLFEDPSPRQPYTRRIQAGTLRKSDVIELGAVLVDGVNPRTLATDIVLYELTPVYQQDLFVAEWGLSWARERGLGIAFDLSD
ncbi:MAG: hypothetical protein ACKVVP_18275 [Chloroflexota bacterium]